MKFVPKNALVCPSIAFTLLGFSSAALSDSVSDDLIEARQETQIWTTYALSPYLRASDLKVSVEDGRATLRGEVAEEVNRDLAKQIALGVGGIASVDNQIVVKADYTPAARTTERGYGDVIDDATISTTVKSKLLWSLYNDAAAINVDTNLGKVTLNGTADSDAAKALAGRIALNTRGVHGLDNRLVVTAAKHLVATKSDITDSWISTKVKSTFIYSSNIDASRINVSTERGVVTLSGKLDGGAQRALAIELAENVRGVKRVNARDLKI